MRIFTYILGIIFVSFSIMQLNDPDPLVWVPAYLVPAAASFVFTHKKQNKFIFPLLAMIYLVGSVLLFPPSIQEWIHAEEKASFGMKLPLIEEARESMGLLICSLTFFFFWIKSSFAGKPPA
jgi:hypothetical protein